MKPELIQAPPDEALQAKEPADDDALTPKKAAKLLYLSFKFSQGDPNTQDYIFRYLHVIRPTWKMDNELRSETRKIAEGKIKSHITPGNQIKHYSFESDPGYVDRKIDVHLGGMQKELNREPVGEEELPEILKIITGRIVASDFEFTIVPRKRPDGKLVYGRPRERVNPNTPGGDLWLSHIFYYGVDDHSTGVAEYDQMFDDVRKAIPVLYPDHSTARGRLNRLGRKYYSEGFGAQSTSLNPESGNGNFRLDDLPGEDAW